MPTLARDIQALEHACSKQGVRLLVAFGSTVRGMRRPDSDLDLAAWLEATRVTPMDLMTLEAQLSPLFLGEHIDLVILNRASPLLQFQVAKHGEPLFEAEPGIFRAFQALALRRYADTAHLRSFNRFCVDHFLRRQAPMIDRELVHRKLSQLVQYLGELEPLCSLSFENYLQQPLSRYAAERLLQLLIETAVDINAHLVVELTNSPPQDDYDSCVKLAQAGALPADFALFIAKSTGLRDRLVHQDEAVDHIIVYQAIGEAIEQYTEYCRHVTHFLDRGTPLSPGGPP